MKEILVAELVRLRRLQRGPLSRDDLLITIGQISSIQFAMAALDTATSDVVS
jgi:hypothetical protein